LVNDVLWSCDRSDRLDYINQAVGNQKPLSCKGIKFNASNLTKNLVLDYGSPEPQIAQSFSSCICVIFVLNNSNIIIEGLAFVATKNSVEVSRETAVNNLGVTVL